MDQTQNPEDPTRPIPKIADGVDPLESSASTGPDVPSAEESAFVPEPDDVSTTEGGSSARHRRRGVVVPVLVGCGLLLAFVVAYLVELLVTSGEIERNTTVAGVEIGGLTPTEAQAAIESATGASFSTTHRMTVHGVVVEIKPDAAGLTADVRRAVAEVGTRSANPIDRVRSFFSDRQANLPVTMDRAALDAYIASVAAKTDVKPVEGELVLKGASIDSVAPVTGWTLDRAAAAQKIAVAFERGGPAALEGLALPAADHQVRTTPEALAKAKNAAATAVSGPITLVAGSRRLTVGVEQIAAVTTIKPDGAGGFSVTVNGAKLRAPLTAEVEKTYTKPVDGSVAITAGKPVITPSIDGKVADWAATEKAISAATAGKDRTATVVYTVTRPKITTEVVKSWGIKEIIGEFKTGGFAYASGVNVRVVAAKVQGAFIAPGATFSLNDFTGPRGREQGYVDAGILIDGAPAKAVGGGISQFATTLYNASYFAGMRDVTHKAHSIWISRYPPGREATVYEGLIDLAFANDYPTAVMIETIWTENDITVRLWGTKHVKVESVSSDRYDYTSPATITRPYGEPCSAQGGGQGFSIDNTRIIRDLSGNEIKREKRTTVYNGSPTVVCAPPPTPTTTPGSTSTPGTTPTTPAGTAPGRTGG